MAACPICKRQDAQERQEEIDGAVAIRCPRCGDFNTRQGGVVGLMQLNDEDRAYLSAWTRSENLRRGEPPMLLRADIDRIIANKRKRGVAEKQGSLLLNLGRQSKFPGQQIPLLNEVDIGLAWAENTNELAFHVKALVDNRWIESDGTLNPAYSLTSQGWQRFSDLERPAGPDSNVVFVAMSFADVLAPVWTDGIRPALLDAGYEGRRVDSGEHVGKIDDRIMAMIRESRFVVVDATTQNVGAYFEAGFALGLGRSVFWTVRADDLVNVHFDTRQFNHVVWTDPADLRTKLTNRILGVVGRWPNG